ncbi:hypothetical protein A2686_04915 [Candidatus Woesebacteria bacterium RIFCSPHIGHO2_01_FULL_38_10]|uniref:Uncharacterized protein n=1 Tax=Candidatus Woesebacteria bacterium RIFCSPLOWO2_01_FULL_39_10b TaxID=1802517 RepID=A0A1F8BAH8_9BACT|nr:MAG: hypothetical protein A2686_04915 [Candidatus Woesebacteria bacterium RIFCSPHIGHO2_01_FULL_38_10]OGM60689.1 MAG: hypothetical protein A2892_01440 [Candidatus Woesebacteria bacterium RIFCSPLOWO2_01_FULL_39_10b]
MKKITYKIGAGIIGATLLGATLIPTVLAADLEITDNGSGSNNTIIVASNNSCEVTQESVTLVGAIVGASAETGNNVANGNTGGNVSVTSGTATANASLSVSGGSNTATNPCCCKSQPDCSNPPTSEISNNGNNSTNTITATNGNSSNAQQGTLTGVRALVDARARTGRNRGNNNTGGSTTLTSGNSSATPSLSTSGGSNTLTNP